MIGALPREAALVVPSAEDTAKPSDGGVRRRPVA